MTKNAPRASPFDWLELKKFWYEISFRIGMNICFRNCTATSAWSMSLMFKKKSNTVCSLSQHVLFPSASHVPFQGRQLPALASSLESLHLSAKSDSLIMRQNFSNHVASRHSVCCTIRVLVHHKTLVPPAPCVHPQSWYRLQALLNAPG